MTSSEGSVDTMIQEATHKVDSSKGQQIGTTLNTWEPDYLQKWIEGYALLVIIIVGSTANLFSLIIIRNKELNLIRDFSRLLQSQVSSSLVNGMYYS